MHARGLKWTGLLISLLQFLSGVLCLATNSHTGFSSVIWLPTAIAFTTLFTLGLNWWPFVILGDLAFFVYAGFNPLVIFFMTLGNTGLLYFCARYLRTKIHYLTNFSRLRDLYLYFIACATVSLIVASYAVTVHVLFGNIPLTRMFDTWRSWWTAQGMGLLILGSFLITWKNDKAHRVPLLAKRKWESILLFSFILGLNIFIFTPLVQYNHTLLIKPYFLFSVMLFTALRFDLVGATFASILISGTSIVGGLFGYVAFATTVSSQDDRMLMLQFMISAITITGLTVAATVREKTEALDARNEFLDIASHELKTPITSLKLQLQLLQRRLDQKVDLSPAEIEQTTFLKKVDRQVNRLVKIVEQLLDVSRAERNLLELEREEVILNDLIQSLADRLSSDLMNAKCSLKIDLPKDTKGYWDPFRLEQVLENLLSNAIKYAPGKAIEVNGTLKLDCVELVVKDHGAGIPLEKQHTIFDRFVRATEIRHVQGLGLGLFITKRIVEAHGGSIKVRSVIGEGTAFTLLLPFKSTPLPN
jgi:signal transduction histidine kinase